MKELQKSVVNTLAFFDLFDHPLTGYELWSWMDQQSNKTTKQPNNDVILEERSDDRIPGGGDPIGSAPPSLQDDIRVEWLNFQSALDELISSGRIQYEDGYICLFDRSELPQVRRARQEWVARKMKKVQRAARLLQWVPFIQMIAVCNRLSVGHPHKESDIDVFIIIKDGRLWLGRLLATLLLQLFGLRRHGSRIADHVCLSFYITPVAADLSAVALHSTSPLPLGESNSSEDTGVRALVRRARPCKAAPCRPSGRGAQRHRERGLKEMRHPPPNPLPSREGGIDDVYMRFWVPHVLPLWARGGVLKQFWQANRWAHHSIHQAPMIEPLIKLRGSLLVYVLEWLLRGRLGDLLDNVTKKIQYQRVTRTQQSQTTATGVVVSDSMLKFHENDRRDFYAQNWEKRKAEYAL